VEFVDEEHRGRFRAAAGGREDLADMTALMRTKRLPVSWAMASAMLVFPQPGGP
jgi:hypothetical protein